MGKTTVFLDETLIKHALQVTNLKTKKDVIEAGLRELVRKRNQELLQQEPGSFLRAKILKRISSLNS